MNTIRLVTDVFKLRIGVAIMLCAVAGAAVMPGPGPGAPALAALALAVLISAAAAGAFNQYAERDLDAHMPRTSKRAFVTGRLEASWVWPAAIVALLAVAVVTAGLATNVVAALYVFLGAFTYGVIYTLWLKRRTAWNIVVGGAAGSFAVLAGAAAVDPELSPAAVILAVVLFLWTPPHFWSLSFVYRDQYALAGVPMLPVVVAPKTAAWIVFAHTVALSVLSLVPVAYGLGLTYLLGAAAGSALFLYASARLVMAPTRENALYTFRASLLQLTLLLLAATLDGWLFGSGH